VEPVSPATEVARAIAGLVLMHRPDNISDLFNIASSATAGNDPSRPDPRSFSPLRQIVASIFVTGGQKVH
jgi:hypothetical protein